MQVDKIQMELNMKNNLYLLLPVALLVIAGCTGPVVSDFNGSSVKIQTYMTTDDEMANALAEATRICGMAGKTTEYASTISLPNYTYQHLYLCL